MRKLLLHWLVFTASLAITAWALPDYLMRLDGVLPAFLASLLLGLLNALVRPFLFVFKLITFPLTLITLGLFSLIVSVIMNALLLWLVGSGWVAGFHVPTYTGAIAGSLILSAVNALLTMAGGLNRRRR